MSVTVDWAGRAIVHVNFLDHWDWREFHQGMQRAYFLMSKSQNRVNLILDFAGSVKHSSTSQLAQIVDKGDVPGNQGIIVIVTEDALLGQKLEKILSRMHPETDSIYVTQEGEEASALIRRAIQAQTMVNGG